MHMTNHPRAALQLGHSLRTPIPTAPPAPPYISCTRYPKHSCPSTGQRSGKLRLIKIMQVLLTFPSWQSRVEENPRTNKVIKALRQVLRLLYVAGILLAGPNSTLNASRLLVRRSPGLPVRSPPRIECAESSLSLVLQRAATRHWLP
jgi:hypothetical protein